MGVDLSVKCFAFASSPKRGAIKPLLLGEVADRRSDGEVLAFPFRKGGIALAVDESDKANLTHPNQIMQTGVKSY